MVYIFVNSEAIQAQRRTRQCTNSRTRIGSASSSNSRGRGKFPARGDHCLAPNWYGGGYIQQTISFGYGDSTSKFPWRECTRTCHTRGEDAALYTTIENENGSENAVVMEMKRMEMQIYPSLVVQYLGGWKWSTYATGCWCNSTMHSMDTKICNTFTTMQRRQ